MHPKFNYPWQQLVLDEFMELNLVSLQSKANKAERVICENPDLP